MKEYEPKTRDWTPQHNGKIHCSPACGRGCTHAEYLEAHKLADALAKKCEDEVGGKWEKRVHENLGWHYEVRLAGADITIHPRGEKYSVASHRGGTPTEIFIRTESTSLRWLVNQQINAVRKQMNMWEDYLLKNGIE